MIQDQFDREVLKEITVILTKDGRMAIRGSLTDLDLKVMMLNRALSFLKGRLRTQREVNKDTFAEPNELGNQNREYGQWCIL